MGKFSKHLGEVAKLEIEGEEFELQPLTIEDLPDFFMAIKSFSGAGKEGNTEDFMKNMDGESLGSLSKLIDKVLVKSYPDEPEEERKAFGLKYMLPLMEKIFEMNTQESGDAEKRLVKKLKDDRNTGNKE